MFFQSKNNDQTSFIEFRFKEFESTIKRMDFLNDKTLINLLLEEEIMITRELYEILIEEKGSLVLGLSDKPKPSSFSKKFIFISSSLKEDEGFSIIYN